MHEIHFRVDDVLYGQLKDLSDASGKPFSKFVTSVLQQYVDACYTASEVKPLFEQIERILGGSDLCQTEFMDKRL